MKKIITVFTIIALFLILYFLYQQKLPSDEARNVADPISIGEDFEEKSGIDQSEIENLFKE